MRLSSRVFAAALAVCCAVPAASAFASDIAVCPAQGCASAAQEITGTITINRRLSKPSVTAPVSIYQRGAAVAPGKDPAEDPIAFERGRVVVYIEGPLPAAAPTARHATFRMEQVNRRFTPDLLVVPVGATVSFPNMDPIFHNIFSLSKPKEFDLGSYDKGDSRSVTFTKPGVVYVYCHLHPNMEAAIVVTPSQYFARVNSTGEFRLPAVPPGEYTIVAWHRSAGFFRRQVVVAAGRPSTADFLIPLPAEPSHPSPPEHSMMHMEGR